MNSEIIEQVIKRDGRVQPFDSRRIYDALFKAMQATADGVNEGLCERLCAEVVSRCEGWCLERDFRSIPVDQVHEFAEAVLIGSARPDVAQEYIRYREKRNLARKADVKAIFDSIIKAEPNDVTRENANMNADTPAGMMMKFASETTKTYVDENLFSYEVQEAVRRNILHVHDKDYYPTRSLTCIQHPTDKLLREGFVCGHASVRSAKRIETAATIACITMEAVQNEMHGGQAIPAFDFYMAPYVRMAYEEEVDRLRRETGRFVPKSFEWFLYPLDRNNTDTTMWTREAFFDFIKKLTFKDYIRTEVPEEIDADGAGDEALHFTNLALQLSHLAINETVRRVHQAMESFVHNMNTIHSRGGNQVVFSSINYGTDISAEGRCVIREILNTTYEGVGNGETAIFPIQIWKKKRGVSYLPGDPNYDLYCFACKVTARRFFPNYLNLDASYNRDDAWRPDDPQRYLHEVATMGCRTRVYANRYGPKTSVGRGNLSFSTVNIVRLAIEAMRSFPDDRDRRIDAFFHSFDLALDVAAKQLNERFAFQAKALKKQFPMLMDGLWLGSEKLGPNDTVESVLNQGTLSIGFIGLAECLIALTGKHHGESEESQELGLRIISHMYDKVNSYAEKYEHNFTLLATPAEGLSGKFTKVDRRDFGVIPGVTDKDYYTNSSHVPVYYHCTPELKAKVEGPYNKYENAGHIFYVEMDGDATHNPEAIMRIVDLMDKYDIGYGSVNHNRIRCLDCGYETSTKGLSVCPKCGGKHLDILQRITGYLVGTTDRWNSGKKAELKDRVVHK